MTKNIYLAFVVLACCLSSCSKWLDVKPASQVSETEQFKSEEGFKDALTGVYQKMAQSTLYGKELTYGFVDILGQNYTNTTAVDHNNFREAIYDYKDAGVESKIDLIWSNAYATIAQANFLLKNIDDKRSLFTGVNYNVIKGEAIALRAFVHFDLLRLFAPAATSSPDAQAIPYMRSFTVQPQARLTVKQVIAECIADLKEAETLLSVFKEQDRIAAPSSPNGDNFLAFRQNHFNYWAVKALMARIYLYNDEKALALEKAKEVISSNYFRFVTSTELNTRPSDIDRTATNEHIFSIYVSNLKTFTDLHFKTSALENVKATFVISNARKNEVFELAAGNSTDLRVNAALWSDSKGIIYYSKLWQEDDTKENLKKRIPLIKLSEMYLIAAETEPSVEEGVKYLNELRDARVARLLTGTVDATILKNEIAKEYRKDFICEGQLFFFYKRNKYTNIPGSISGQISDKQYVLPLPLREIEFGN